MLVWRNEAAARLVALLMVIAWAVLGIVIVVGYQPGGPVDSLVGGAAFLPTAIAAAALVWPPRAEGSRATAAILWLGIGSILLVVPILLGVVEAIAAGGRQTLLPSLEVAYASVLALGTTAAYTALGFSARERKSGARPARTRGLAATLLALALTATGTGLFGSLALANEQALRSRPQPPSAWGPTDPTLVPPLCDEPLALGPSAALRIDATATIDGQVAGTVRVQGLRNVTNESWLAERRSSFGDGDLAYRRIGNEAELHRDDGDALSRRPGLPGGPTSPALTLDGPILELIQTPDAEAVIQSVALEIFDGAPARHCRRQIDGPSALRASFPLRWLIDSDLAPGSDVLVAWRGNVDWWVFADGQLGQAVVSIGGYPGDAWASSGIYATLEATLTALDRDIARPLPGSGS